MNFQNPEFNGLELSTILILEEAKKRGLKIEILDKSDNFIRLTKGGKCEIIKQATRTSLDNYIAPLIMENKKVTKQLLAENGINTPGGMAFSLPVKAVESYSVFKDRDIVIKPNSTNFGKGITILKVPFSQEEFKDGITSAFHHDTLVLIEDYYAGKEYRFLVIGEEVVAVLHRIPANVVGDGISTIRQLVTKKNMNPLRGEGYVKPLEKIKTGEMEEAFLKNQGKDWDTIPGKGEQVFLRKNSNISTGGDSRDYTDEVHPGYKEIALNAVKAVGAVISGADMVIRDINAVPEKENYTIIELNFNPAIHIHAYPYEGLNRKPEKKILDLLGFL